LRKPTSEVAPATELLGNGPKKQATVNDLTVRIELSLTHIEYECVGEGSRNREVISAGIGAWFMNRKNDQDEGKEKARARQKGT
jgi:hypothetical protein